MKWLDDALGHARWSPWRRLPAAGRAVGRRVLPVVLDLVIFAFVIGLWLVVLTRGVTPWQ